MRVCKQPVLYFENKNKGIGQWDMGSIDFQFCFFIFQETKRLPGSAAVSSRPARSCGLAEPSPTKRRP